MSEGNIEIPIETLGSLRIYLNIKSKTSVAVSYVVNGIAYKFTSGSTYGWYRKTFLPEMNNLIAKAKEIDELPLMDDQSSISMDVFTEYGAGSIMRFYIYKSKYGTTICTQSTPRDRRYSGHSTSQSIEVFEKDLNKMIEKMRKAINTYESLLPDSFMRWNGKHL